MLPKALDTIKKRYLQRSGGDKEFVELLYLIQQHGMDTVQLACEQAVQANTTQLSAVINLIHRLTEPSIELTLDAHPYPTLAVQPQANCQRYEQLRPITKVVQEVEL